MHNSKDKSSASLSLLKGILPIGRASAWRDVFSGISLASMDIPQVLGYARIAGMPAVTGLYTVFLPLVAFAFFGASRHLVVAADSATATIFASRASTIAPMGSAEYVALAGMVALLTAVQLQPVPAVTPTVPVAAADVVRLDDVGEIVKVRLARPRDRLALAQDPLYIDYRTSVLEFLYHRQKRPVAQAA